MLAFLLVFVSQAYAAPDQAPVKSEIKLTDQQKQEIAALEKEILKQKKTVITKYVEFGVLSEAQGKEIISRMEKRYQMMEQNGFVPRFDKPMHRHCR
ncbi:MAG TPA: YckD family protein [Syntrophomonadaceae bacterium]|jgi:L-2-hydroxyglutarate oxidase LhgO|nr:YckD family protein [Syntrophomonadaceae bacterium]HRX21381.1 YckD family protein [Syntrophomonadaceae bacterium]